MTGGDIDFTYALFVLDGLNETDQAIALGQLIEFNSDGWDIASAKATGASGPFGVALDVIPVTSGQIQLRVLVRGVVEILKVSGALSQGQGVMPTSTAGSVGAWAIPSVSGTPSDAEIEAAITAAIEKTGMVVEDAASGDAAVKTLFGG